MAFSQRDLYQVRREIEKDSKHKCAIIYGGLPPGEETLVCIHVCFKGPPSRFAHQKVLARIFLNFVICNPCQSCPSLTIVVPVWFFLISLVFFYLSKLIYFRFPSM